ncbi:MAG TPA: hypothetical protein VFA90_15065 [Terriglobales bacterium]|nr:hypothetical protein [Terriglobales bacterium]
MQNADPSFPMSFSNSSGTPREDKGEGHDQKRVRTTSAATPLATTSHGKVTPRCARSGQAFSAVPRVRNVTGFSR